ncbi:SRPBCC family protein [Georgenia daeguensis]|uniref:Carbon monoxide dehydrogenase n=1 Tax=Georgenia daeguensis TaxID=908355 RepID=A0ABP8EUM2_9MICO
MTVELTHTFTIPAAPDAAWELLTDLNRVGGCFPGATVTEAGAEEFSGTVKVKLGPIALTYAGTGKFLERDDAGHRAVIEARGKDRRGNGTASATVTMSLTGDGGGSRAEVLTDLSVTGKPAQFGRGVMQDVSDKLLGQFVACIERQFAGDAPDGRPAGAATASRSGEAPSRSGATAEPGDSASPADLAASAGPTPSPSPRPAPSERPRPQPVPPAGPVPPQPVTPAEPVPPLPVPPAEPGPPQPVTPAHQDDAIDLGSAVLPVLLQRYAGALAVGLAGFAMGVLVGRAGRE